MEVRLNCWNSIKNNFDMLFVNIRGRVFGFDEFENYDLKMIIIHCWEIYLSVDYNKLDRKVNWDSSGSIDN